MRSVPARDAARVIDAIDRACLCRTWGRRQSEVRVATGLSENVQFVIHTAASAVGSRIIECPVSVDEPVADRARAAVARQQAMAVDQPFAKLRQRVLQV